MVIKSNDRIRSAPPGFGLLEVVLVIALLAIVIPALLRFSFAMTIASNQQVRQVEAVYLAEEALEAIRSIRAESWSAGIQPLGTGTPYYLVLSGNQWTLSTTNPGFEFGRYQRSVLLDAVYRDETDDIVATGGTLDARTRRVTATVSWQRGDEVESVSLATYVTDLFGN